MMPTMSLRVITDNFKIFMQCIDEIQEFGAVFSFAFIAFLPIGFSIFYYVDSGIGSIGVVLALYEVLSVMVCAYYYIFMLDPKYKDTSISSFFNIGWYAWESLKNVFIDLWIWVTDDILIYFITSVSTVDDVAVLGVFITA